MRYKLRVTMRYPSTWLQCWYTKKPKKINRRPNCVSVILSIIYSRIITVYSHNVSKKAFRLGSKHVDKVGSGWTGTLSNFLWSKATHPLLKT